MHKGELHKKMLEFHSKYGPIVRIAPNELSYADGDAWQDIYITKPGQRPFQRNRTWFKKSYPGEPLSIMGYDEEAHARFRRVFANSFSDKSLRDQAPVIESYVDLFMAKLRHGKSVDLEKLFNYLTFDISGDLSFGESFECLEGNKMHPWVEIATSFGKGLALVASINQYPPVDKLLRYVIPKKVVQRMKSHAEMSQARSRKRLALDTSRLDFVTPAKKYADQKNTMTDGEWDINLMIIIFAASETLSSALTATVRELVQHPGALYRATQEVRSAFATESDIKIASTGNLPYLNAVINESLRLAPPAAIGTPRVVPTGGAIVCGRHVPGGVCFSPPLHISSYDSAKLCYRLMLPTINMPPIASCITSRIQTHSFLSATFAKLRHLNQPPVQEQTISILYNPS
jgi:cytochrome P450